MLDAPGTVREMEGDFVGLPDDCIAITFVCLF